MCLRIAATLLAGSSLITSWLVLSSATRSNATAFEKPDSSWKKHAINDQSPFEAAGTADFNGDGKIDIFCGDSWYEAPKWTRHKVRDVPASQNPHYYEDFADSPLDCNGDGRPDIVTCNYFGGYVGWVENPGHDATKPWIEHEIDRPGSSETGELVDINGDGRPDFLPNVVSGSVVWYELTQQKPEVIWTKHELGKEGAGHGVGVGDINSDGRLDIITPSGWYEQPKPNGCSPHTPCAENGTVNGTRSVPTTLAQAEDSRKWPFHAEFQLGAAGIFILGRDFDGDKRTDIVWGMGHNFGLHWLIQAAGAEGKREWKKEDIDTTFSQVHTLLFADLDGDGDPELVTGKRIYAHETEPGATDAPCVYAFKFDRSTSKWQKRVIYEGEPARNAPAAAKDRWALKDFARGSVGTGLQMVARDMDGDGDITFNDTFAWTGGPPITGTGRLRLNGATTTSGDPGGKVISGRTVDNAGTFIFADLATDPAPGIQLEDGAVWNNLPGSVFEIRTDAQIIGPTPGMNPVAFNNAGTVRKVAGDIAAFPFYSVPFNNTGTIAVDVGQFVLFAGGTSSGNFTVADGAVLHFAGGHMLDAASSVAGAGVVVFQGTGDEPAATFGGTYNITGETIAGGGLATFSGNVIDIGEFTAHFGRVRFTGNFTQTAGERMIVDVGAFPSGDPLGAVNVTGQATLAGTLQLAVAAGYQPQIGDNFKVLTYGSRVGTFTTINGRNLGGGLRLVESYNAADLTVTVAAALRARGGAGSLVGQASSLPSSATGSRQADSLPYDYDALAPFVSAAIARWAAAGVAPDLLDSLRGVSIRIGDLPDDLLGLAASGVIWLDHDAAGYGWYVDATPADDGEFAPASRFDEIDLLTVLAHELGHILSLDDLDPLSHSDDLMAGTLAPGVRHTTNSALVDDALARWDW